jgi:uncharacterized SAM-binding protein YcdF (DUF218 family)
MKKTFKIIALGFALKLLVFGLIILHACTLTQKEAMKLYSKAHSSKPYDVIIVPGVPYEKGKSNAVMKFRVYWSYVLYSRGIAKNVIYSGASVYTPYTEGKIMAIFGHAYGIPKDKIFSETKAEHSTENLYYSYWMARKKGYTRIALATDPGQSALLKRFAKKKRLNVDFIPIVYDYVSNIPYIEPMIVDSLMMTGNFIPLPERENHLERLKGMMGYKIDKNAIHSQ